MVENAIPPMTTKEAGAQMNQPLSGGGDGSFGGFAVLANEGDKGLCGAREAAIAAVNEAKLRAVRQRVARTDHEAQAILIDVVNLEIRRLDRERHDTDVDRAVFHPLQYLVAEVAVDTDVNQRIAALKFGKHIRQKIEAGGFVGAKNYGALHDIAAVRDNLDGFITETQKFFGIIEQDLAGRRQLDGFGGAVEELGTVGLFELADLRADGRLRTENFLPGARKTLELGNVDESGELVEVHGQIARREL